MRRRMTYDEALLYLEEAIAHRDKLTPGTDKDLVYLVEAQIKQFESLVNAFKLRPDK